jgi:uridylate kinase
MRRPAASRILLKLSGEAFGSGDGALSPESVSCIAQEIASLAAQVAIVVGGGNILRGAQTTWLTRVDADSVGMLATVLNSLVLRSALECAGRAVELQSAVSVDGLPPISTRRAVRALESGEVVLFAGGTGSPFVSTDTAAAIRAVAIEATLLAKASNVDGVYDSDPLQNAGARLLADVSYDEYLANRYGVMDQVAVEICREHRLPIEVFPWRRSGALQSLLSGSRVGTRIS